MIRYYTTILSLFLFILNSCDNNTDSEFKPDAVPHKHYTLVGEWEWISSCGGYGGDCYTPQNTGNSLSLAFFRSGSVYVLENSDTVLFSKYHKEREWSYDLGKEADILYYDCDSVFSTYGGYFIIGTEIFSRFVIFYLTDTLYFFEAEVGDGYGHTFKRKQNND